MTDPDDALDERLVTLAKDRPREWRQLLAEASARSVWDARCHDFRDYTYVEGARMEPRRSMDVNVTAVTNMVRASKAQLSATGAIRPNHRTVRDHMLYILGLRSRGAAVLRELVEGR